MSNFDAILSLMKRSRDFWESCDRYLWLREAEELGVRFGLSTTFVAALDVRILNLFRRIVDAISAKDADSAAILSRALFENLLALMFLAVEDFEVTVGVKHLFPPQPGKPSRKLDRRTRAFMYLYHCAMEDVRLAEKPRASGLVEQTTDAELAKVDECRSLLDPDLAQVVDKSKKFSGMTVEQQCEFFGGDFVTRYAVTYDLESRPAHGAYAISGLGPDDFNFRPLDEASEERVSAVALNALALFLESWKLTHSMTLQPAGSISELRDIASQFVRSALNREADPRDINL